jgi:hypothetical protein
MPFDMTPHERIAWQAVLGSDIKKEMISIFRISNGIEPFSILARPKGALVVGTKIPNVQTHDRNRQDDCGFTQESRCARRTNLEN